MDLAIETQDLSKRYGPVRAVDAVNIRVRPGEIYAFLGLNGAGKSTTIRALLGMIRPTAGSVRLLDRGIGPGGRGPWSRVGHLVEAPSAYPELTVRENLEIARRLHGITDRSAVDSAIERLGLIEYAHRRSRTLSSGNLQRLALARAILHGPELLILDEPANGLDPAGVVEIRELLAGMTRERGTTVFMSSHILTEVDRLATRIGIIHQGRLIEELDADRLLALRSQRLEVKTRDPESAGSILAAAGYTVTREGEMLFLTDARALASPDVVAAILVGAELPPLRLAIEHEELERHFLRLTGQ